ncbi:hypothetical protein HDU86_006331 [Geranomyces michiganensis]|nr:hypothetical protein HDU86_006331 [Geranomyces michiganensis]
MDVISSSSRRQTYDQVLKGPNSTETLSKSIHAAVLTRYGDYKTVIAMAGQMFETKIDGELYLILVGTVKLTAYDENNLVLVIATPRNTIFAKIDSAQKHSVIMAVGLTTGIAVLMALIFALIVAPLRHLAKSMVMLTQMDFAALENGKILAETSYISEIRAVQRSFTTMVLAFAAGIKKNRELGQFRANAQRDSAAKRNSELPRTSDQSSHLVDRKRFTT